MAACVSLRLKPFTDGALGPSQHRTDPTKTEAVGLWVVSTPSLRLSTEGATQSSLKTTTCSVRATRAARRLRRGFPNMPFRVAGQGARRELIDPRNFPPARPIPLYPKPRVNSASQITEDMPISTQQHVEISRIAQHEANFDAASSRIRQVLTGADPFMLSVIMNRLRVFYQVSKALGEDTTAYGRGSSNLVAELARLGQRIANDKRVSKEKKERYERERKKYIDKHSRATKGYETPSATRRRAVETWFKTADETDTKQEAASARKAYLKKKRSNLLATPQTLNCAQRWLEAFWWFTLGRLHSKRMSGYSQSRTRR